MASKTHTGAFVQGSSLGPNGLQQMIMTPGTSTVTGGNKFVSSAAQLETAGALSSNNGSAGGGQSN